MKALGKLSRITAPVTLLGPAFVTTSCSERRQVSEHRGCRRSDRALLEIAPPLVPQGSSPAHLGRRAGAEVVGGRWMPP
jgi:hypothetical protein